VENVNKKFIEGYIVKRQERACVRISKCSCAVRYFLGDDSLLSAGSGLGISVPLLTISRQGVFRSLNLNVRMDVEMDKSLY
jgi:hypothetical protein